jgi:hypothetical protein
MRTSRALPLLAAAAAVAACSTWPWLGGTRAARGAPQLPPTPVERLHSAEYYSDLGPDAIDVAAYPPEQRRNYEVFARACSRCHTLARAINAPIVSRGWWEFYVAGMRVRSRLQGEPMSAVDVKAALDFLEYDGRQRKLRRAREFERDSDELKERFDAELARRLGAMQKASPGATPAALP